MHRDVVKWNGIHSSRHLRLAYAQAQCPYNTSSENIKHKKNTSNAWFSSIVDNLHSLTNAPSNVGEAEQTYTSCTEEHVTSSGASSLAIATDPRVSAEEVPAACPAQCSAPCSIPTKTPIVTDADAVHIDAYSMNGTDLIESHSGESSKVSIRKTLANEENQRFEDDQKSPQTDSAEDASLVFNEKNKDTRSKLVESLHIDSYSELEKLIGSTVDRVYEKIQGTALKACALDSLNQGIIENFPRREIRPPALERDKERDAELAIHLYGLKKQVETLKEMWDNEERERQRQSNASKDTPKTIRVEVFRAYESEPVPYKKKPFAPLRPSSLPVGNTSSRTSSSLTRSLNGTTWASSSSVSTKITTTSSFKDESYSDDFE